jgi:hypothetical protein
MVPRELRERREQPEAQVQPDTREQPELPVEQDRQVTLVQPEPQVVRVPQDLREQLV